MLSLTMLSNFKLQAMFSFPSTSPYPTFDFTLCTPCVCCLLNGQLTLPSIRRYTVAIPARLPTHTRRQFCTCTSARLFNRLRHFCIQSSSSAGAAAQMFCSMRLASSASRARRLKPRWLLDSLACAWSAVERHITPVPCVYVCRISSGMRGTNVRVGLRKGL